MIYWTKNTRDASGGRDLRPMELGGKNERDYTGRRKRDETVSADKSDIEAAASYL